ncbi:alpha-hydroxy-acid oxidizing protein [Mesorhizobium hawassense]|uniref:alpha-hydroxy-acid oxidizing protein n=1 Tax=Mesorhizobium hawassense TaxID=1209954 RepID=UPI00142D2200|nr:alpha-hydroxy-acid oxidizing protein [Mesorhizobium hawassense]
MSTGGVSPRPNLTWYNGRAALFGAVAGQGGVERMLDILLDEIATGLKLSGMPGFQQVGPDLVAPPG